MSCALPPYSKKNAVAQYVFPASHACFVTLGVILLASEDRTKYTFCLWRKMISCLREILLPTFFSFAEVMYLRIYSTYDVKQLEF
jgi:hypothetical protein